MPDVIKYAVFFFEVFPKRKHHLDSNNTEEQNSSQSTSSSLEFHENKEVNLETSDYFSNVNVVRPLFNEDHLNKYTEEDSLLPGWKMRTKLLDTLSKSFFSIPHFNSGIDHFILLKRGIQFPMPELLSKSGRTWSSILEVNSFTLLIKSGIDFQNCG